MSCWCIFAKNYPPINSLILRAFGGKCCECCECCEPKSHFRKKPLFVFTFSKSRFLPPKSPVFVLLKVRFFFLRVLVFVLSLSPVFLPPQSPCFVLFRATFLLPQSPLPSSSSSDSRSHPLRVLFHHSPSPLPSSPIHVPILSESSSVLFRPLPSSSEPKKTAERHEAVPPFLVVVCSKMEHSSFISCSSTVCSRTA